jgi:hypothetical protein
MYIADGEYRRGVGECGAHYRPALGPPVKGGAEELEWVLSHPLVLFA